ncbi:tyrosine-type recombinase/integrase [Pseudoalteromonas aurantia]|uniref:Integrase n=1 Tax=Pseudoalteromonas aurantia TaxID=43654 RepID=A0A5S3V3M5_9GAMM|nr:site-specific integrase [Pseudoalteromonas aurantia]TMO64856.1 integrase [Pseudoalteromonas aurantia]
MNSQLNKSEKKRRIKTIDALSDYDMEISSVALSENSVPIELKGGKKYFKTQVNYRPQDHEPLFHFPMLFNQDGSPWYEGNQFILSVASDYSFEYDTTKIARKASALLDYKIWCEENDVDMFNYSARRPKNRPSYRYFSYLLDEGKSAGNLNTRTKLVYDFTCYFSSKYQIDKNRIDQVTDVQKSYSSKTGETYQKKLKKRSQTKARNNSRSSVDNSLVLDDGEYLKPLDEDQQKLMFKHIKSSSFNVDERLIFQFAVDTGARKQSILTLRLKHLEHFKPENLKKDGTYEINAGQGCLMDSKNSKNITIKVPSYLAESLKIYANSKAAKKRRKLFVQKYGNIFTDPDEMYVFLGKRGDCRYMAKSDPRFSSTRTPPSGGSIKTIVNRLFKVLENDNDNENEGNHIPSDFTFHWLRATFAYNLYLHLLPLVDAKKMTYSDQIAFIQDALGHDNPSTTENYLKLFTSENVLEEMQETWEERLFQQSAFDLV